MSCSDKFSTSYLPKKILKDDLTPPIKRRNAASQTVLTLPPVLPKHVEDVLSSYINYNEDQQQTYEDDVANSTVIDHEARDASLRRKLFERSFDSVRSCDILSDLKNDIAHLSPPPRSPEINIMRSARKSRDIFNTSFACISPIRRESFGALSPIAKTDTPVRRRNGDRLCGSDSSIALIGSTPERLTRSLSSQYMETSSSELKPFERSYDDELMQISQQSLHPTTPLRRNKNRVANRKNLSQSFSLLEPPEIVKMGDDDTTQHRLDSGFNDASEKLNDYIDKCTDISMKSILETTDHLISSTPSKTN